MRGLFGSLSRGFAPQNVRASAGVPSYGMIPALGSVPSATGLLISQATAMSVTTVYSCVRRRSIDVARCTPSLYTEQTDGTRIPVKKHPLTALFLKPNRVQTWLEFCEQMAVGFLLRGNAYAVIRRNSRGDPIELIPINPDAVMVLEAANGQIFYNINRIGLWQIAMLRDFPVAIPAEDVLHLRGLSFNAVVAASTIGLARDGIGLAMAQEQQASRWIGNGARPSGVLKSPKRLTDEAATRLKNSWQNFTAGVQNTGTTAVLEDGVEWQQLALTSVDLEFLNQRNFQVLEICRLFNVPPHKVALADKAASQNIPQQDQDYVSNTIAPDLQRWEQKIVDCFDLAKQGIRVDFDQSELLRADGLTRMNIARLGVLTGILTPNEVRRTENLPPKPGADQLLVPSNTAALGSDMTGTPADGGGQTPGNNPGGPPVPTGGNQPGASDVDQSGEDAAPDDE
jgi:HK97 family phage portal protein